MLEPLHEAPFLAASRGKNVKIIDYHITDLDRDRLEPHVGSAEAPMLTVEG
jgi:hypothetical protein